MDEILKYITIWYISSIVAIKLPHVYARLQEFITRSIQDQGHSQGGQLGWPKPPPIPSKKL